jgi:hypothetical protein
MKEQCADDGFEGNFVRSFPTTMAAIEKDAIDVSQDMEM